MSVQTLDELIRLRSQVARLDREREIVATLDRLVEEWLNPSPLSESAGLRGFRCDSCDGWSEFVSGDGAELCFACWREVVLAACRAERPDTSGHARCICGKERRWVDAAGVEQVAPSFPMQVYYTDRWNENRSIAVVNDNGTETPEEEPRTLPDWVRFEAMKVELSCPAKHHLVEVLTTEWYGNDVVTSEDEGRQDMMTREEEDAHLFRSLHDPALERWDGEYASYESQDEFVTRLTEQRRLALYRLLKAVGADPSAPETLAWIKDTVEDTTVVKSKRYANGRVYVKNGAHGNALRGYSRCISILKARIEDGSLSLR